jgi:integrase
MSKTNIEMNMLRERAKPLPEVTQKMFESCNPHNVQMIKYYLQTSNTLSEETLKQYKSGLYQFTYYLKENLMDKPFYKVTKFDFKRYMSYLVSRGLSSSGLKFKKSSISAFCSKFIEVFIVEEDENYKTFRNFTTGVIEIPKNVVYNKIPITKDEYDLTMKTLKDDENYMGMAWVATMWNVGCRRAECIQFKTEIINYDANGKTYIMSHHVRGKGRGDGKKIQYMIPLDVIEYLKLWIEKRGYEHEYIFTTKYGGEIKVMSKTWADDFCVNVLSDILGRRINVHLFKNSCVTHLLEKGVDMKVVSKYVAHHESTSTTAIYDLRNDDEEKDGIFS